MRIYLFVAFISLALLSSSVAAEDCVILLHGLARTPYSMSAMARFLRQNHYRVINESYPNTKKSIQQLANENLPLLIHYCQQSSPEKIHFVTHSLGGLVVKSYLQHHTLSNLGRIVMLAPPHHGSRLADLLHNNWLFKTLTGPAGQELTTDNLRSMNELALPKSSEVGIIAGNVSFSPFSKWIFKEDNDGKVGISSARITGMKDFIVLPVSHMFMMRNPKVMQETLYFLGNGAFNHGTTASL